MKKKVSVFILWYLRFFAKLQIKKINPLIIGIGGASGKSSLVNFTYAILKNKFQVRQSKGKNSETGIPLDILEIPLPDYKYTNWLKAMLLAPIRGIFSWKKFVIYIAEMGIDSPFEPKNMSYLLKVIKPKIATLTNISFEHSAYFDPLVENEDVFKRSEDILSLTAKEEGLLLTSMDKNGTVVLNIDDNNIKKLKKDIQAKIITVSRKDKGADFFIESVKNFIDEFMVSFKFENNKYALKINNPLPEHFAYTFILAIAIAKASGVDVKDSIKYLENDFTLPPGRMSVFKGIKDTVIVDSSYNNATLTPILDLLSFVSDIGKQRRRIGVIGDMRELGTLSKIAHEQVASKILETLDLVILIGPLTQQYVLPILKKNHFPVYSFLNFSSAKATIFESIKPKDMILIKGSQNTLFLERVVEMLLKNSQDKDKLCRRGDYWEELRKKTL